MSDSLWVNIRPTYILAYLFILHLHKELMRGIYLNTHLSAKTTKKYSASNETLDMSEMYINFIILIDKQNLIPCKLRFVISLALY